MINYDDDELHLLNRDELVILKDEVETYLTHVNQLIKSREGFKK